MQKYLLTGRHLSLFRFNSFSKKNIKYGREFLQVSSAWGDIKKSLNIYAAAVVLQGFKCVANVNVFFNS